MTAEDTGSLIAGLSFGPLLLGMANLPTHHKKLNLTHKPRVFSHLESCEDLPLWLQDSNVIQHPGEFESVLCIVNHLWRGAKNANLTMNIQRSILDNFNYLQYVMTNCFLSVILL